MALKHGMGFTCRCGKAPEKAPECSVAGAWLQSGKGSVSKCIAVKAGLAGRAGLKRL